MNSSSGASSEREGPKASRTEPQHSAGEYTPGPWALLRQRDYGEFDKRLVSSNCTEDGEKRPGVNGKNGGIMIAHTLGPDADANAHLIASAPELYEALRTIIDWADFALKNPREFDSHGVRNLDGPAFDTARAALAKAEGRQ